MIVERTLVYDHWYRLWRLKVRMPNGAEVERHLEDHGSAVALLPYDPERRVAMLVSMPRAPVLDAGEPPLIEVIAGNVGDNVQHSARAEASEEAGLRIGELEPLATVWSMPAFSTEKLHMFLATYSESDRIGPGGGAEGEDENITAFEMPLSELRAMRIAGTLTDGKTMLLVQALELARPDLFTV
jgi:nudix-type nucleoside diphosphatase (YffH/AdpP family)